MQTVKKVRTPDRIWSRPATRPKMRAMEGSIRLTMVLTVSGW
jgi:hypothetical protein